jgi:thymidylate synthase (FAD)
MGSAKLIAMTHCNIQIPVEGKPDTFHLMSAESFIAYCARVSNPANQNNTETAEKLLKYLVKNKHWSPFEMVHVVMEIETTRDIARQILRHRSFSFQEFSQRYAAVAEMNKPREARLQDQKNRQNSIENEDSELQDVWDLLQEQLTEDAKAAYDWAIKNGIAKEQARVVLPEGLTMSRMYMSGSLRSWIHYCELRMGNGTQKEHREIATQCWNNIVKKFPSLENVLNNDN